MRSDEILNAPAAECAAYYACQFPAMIDDWRSRTHTLGAETLDLPVLCLC